MFYPNSDCPKSAQNPNISWGRTASPHWQLHMLFRVVDTHTHTHTHTYIYIYIYIYRERERETELEKETENIDIIKHEFCHVTALNFY